MPSVIPALASAPANRPFQQGTQCLQVETIALCRTAVAEPHQQQPDREGRNGPGTLKETEEVTEMRNSMLGFNYPYANVRSGQETKIKYLDTVNGCFAQQGSCKRRHSLGYVTLLGSGT